MRLPLSDPLPGLGRTFRQRLRDAVARRRGLPVVYHYPPIVQIVPGNACNLRCRACTKAVYPTDNRMLDERVYDRVRTQLMPHASLVDLQGLGECMLSPLFMRMVRDAAAMGLEIRFTTNGTRLSPEVLPTIVASRCAMTVSIDGATAATHENLRPGSDFARLTETLRLVRAAAAAPCANRDFAMHFNTVLSVVNLDEVEGIIDLAAETGAKKVTLIAPAVGGRDDEFAAQAIGAHESRLVTRAGAIAAHGRARAVEVVFPPFILAQMTGGCVLPTPTARAPFPQQCPDPWRTVYVDVDGWIRPCCRATMIGMGNVLDTPFWDIWNGPHYLRLRQVINTPAPPAFCRGCSLPWGITAGDPDYVGKLEAHGIVLPPPTPVGITGDPRWTQPASPGPTGTGA